METVRIRVDTGVVLYSPDSAPVAHEDRPISAARLTAAQAAIGPARVTVPLGYRQLRLKAAVVKLTGVRPEIERVPGGCQFTSYRLFGCELEVLVALLRKRPRMTPITLGALICARNEWAGVNVGQYASLRLKLLGEGVRFAPRP